MEYNFLLGAQLANKVQFLLYLNSIFYYLKFEVQLLNRTQHFIVFTLLSVITLSIWPHSGHSCNIMCAINAVYDVETRDDILLIIDSILIIDNSTTPRS